MAIFDPFLAKVARVAILTYMTTGATARADDAADCYNQAFNGPFTAAEAASLCSGGGSSATAQCALGAYNGPFTADQAVALCRRGGTAATTACALDVQSRKFERFR